MNIKEDLKKLIIDSLALEEIIPDDIKDDEPLFEEGLGLDSIDALELGMAIKRKYNISLESNKEENRKTFYSRINGLKIYKRTNFWRIKKYSYRRIGNCRTGYQTGSKSFWGFGFR